LDSLLLCWNPLQVSCLWLCVQNLFTLLGLFAATLAIAGSSIAVKHKDTIQSLYMVCMFCAAGAEVGYSLARACAGVLVRLVASVHHS
jgi:hypothetical protein